ncbi:exocyst complex component Sec5-domain-containing protein [Coemansia spiralis]|nr:exocyst complex component Sec5-domain-containing protein [Coemansia spiralis]
MHSTTISDRDPLHVHRSVSAVLESKGDAHSLSDMSYRAQFSISSKSFSPTSFMQVIHSDTPYADLVQGARLLRESVSQGTEALKILVYNNFDRFVDARNKIDLLYDEMKSRSLNEQAEYGTRAFSQSLQGTTQRADEIYNPIIDRRARLEKIRSTLSVVERYKFYFNLPSSLIDYTRKGRFDIAVREYKKGRQLLQAVTNGNIEATSELITDDTQTNALSKIFQYVWKEVQESVVELRNALFRHLAQPSHTYGEQENIIRYLIEIDPGEKDPVAYYLERQHAWIVDKMDSIYKEYKQKAIQVGHQQLQSERRRTLNTSGSSTKRRADELVRALSIDSFSDFPAFARGRDVEFHMWKQIYSALRSLSQEIVRCLPDFWKLSQAYMEELYQKPAVGAGEGRRRRQGLNLEKVSKCHSLLEEIIEKYSQHVLRLIGILGETDKIVSLETMSSRNIGATMQRLPQTHALLSGHFMTAIIELVVNTANDIEAIDMAQEPAIILANLISQLKAGLELFLCEMWDRDAQSMALHENWCLHHGTSYWPPLYISRRDRQNADGSPSAFTDTIANTELLPLERSHEMYDMAMDHVKRTFFGTMYSFLDTLHVLAFDTSPSLGSDDAPVYGSTRDKIGTPTDTMPTTQASDFFVLATLCNLTAFRLFVVPDLLHCKAVRHVFKLDVADELPRLERMLRRLDEMVFSYYIRDKSKQLSSIVHRGVLMGGFSWSTTELPKDTQPYVSEALLYLVFTHAEIMDLIAEPLTKRVFQVLTENLAQDMLESIRSIDSFSIGGMLQCILESLFINRTLQMYMTAPAKECFRLLYSYVRSAFERTQERAKKAAAQHGRQLPDHPSDDLREMDGIVLATEHWDIVNKLLRDCTRRTQIQFRCFQQSTGSSM